MGIEYAEIVGAANGRLVNRNARFEVGVPVGYQLQDGVTGKQVSQVDRLLAEVIRDIRFMEAFVGDRKEHLRELASRWQRGSLLVV